MLGTDRTTVTRLVKAGKIKASKLPGTTGAYLFRRTDVERYMTKRRAA